MKAEGIPSVSRKEKTYTIGRTNDQSPSSYMDPVEISDPYFWLRDESRSDKEVIEYLENENSYFKKYLEGTEESQEKIFQRIKSYVKETDQSYPCPLGESDFESPFRYYSKTFEGKGYVEHWRVNQATGKEECYLDENKLAEGHEYCDVAAVKVSYDHRYLFYGVDYNGDEWKEIKMYDLEKKEFLDHSLGPLRAGFSVISHSNNIYYTVVEEKTERSYQIWRYDFVTQEKKLIYQEDDSEFSVGKALTEDKSELFIYICSSDVHEFYHIPLDPETGLETGPLELLHSREKEIKVDFESWNSNWVIISNHADKKSHKLYITPKDKPEFENWKLVECSTLLPETALVKEKDTTLNTSSQVDINRIVVSKNWMRVGLNLEDLNLDYMIYQNDPHWRLMTNLNHDLENTSLYLSYYNSDTIWVGVSSPVQPRILYQTTVQAFLENDPTQHYIHLDTKDAPNYDPDLYECKRMYLPSHDQELIPVTVTYRKDLPSDAPVYLYGYGAYGVTIPPKFLHCSRLMEDLGFIRVTAHVRGGGMRGEKWYLDGKMSQKINTFKDFIEVAKYFKFEYQNPEKPRVLSAEGASAGGLLMGAVYTMGTNLFDIVQAGVPFVDVIATMSDETIPLTTGEWKEWGNPNTEKGYKDMIEYSPYDNLSPGVQYPPLLMTSGLYDPRVQYWEPTKFMAKLRYLTSEFNDHRYFLKTNMHKGHFSNTDRYDQWKEAAEEVALMLKVLNLIDHA